MLNELITTGRYALSKAKENTGITDTGELLTKGVDFLNGFQYQSQDMNDYHNSASDVKELRHQTMQQRLGVPISNEAPKKETVVTYLKSLSPEDLKVYEHLQNEGYGYNDIVAYMGVKDKYENPMASGLGIFEKKKTEVELNWNPIVKNGLVASAGLGIQEGIGRLLENTGKNIQKTQVGPTVSDWYNSANYQSDSMILKKWEDEVARIEKEIKEIVKTGKGEEKLGALEKELDRAKGYVEQYSHLTKKDTVADTMVKYDATGSDEDQYIKARAEKTFMWQKDVENAMANSKTSYKMEDVIDSLSREDFNVDEDTWKKYQKIIKKVRESYADKEYNAKDFYKEIEGLGISNKKLEGESSSVAMRDIKDVLRTKADNVFKEAMEAENPGIGKKISDYSLLTRGQNKASDAATSAIKKTTEGEDALKNSWLEPFKKLKENTVKSKAFKNSFGKGLEIVGKYMQPSSYIKALTSIGVKPKIAEGIVNGTIKATEATKNLTKSGIMKGVKVLGAVALPLTLIDWETSLNAAPQQLDYAEKLAGLEAKLNWKGGSSFYKGMTEKDWEKKGYSRDDILNLLSDEGFLEYLSSQGRNGFNFDVGRYESLLE